MNPDASSVKVTDNLTVASALNKGYSLERRGCVQKETFVEGF
jgi:hypothetical protein